MECKIDGCSKPSSGARGMCWTHYDRFRRHGDPLKLGPRGELGTRYSIPEEAFEAKVEKTETCWLWGGKSSGRGAYGTIWSGNKSVLVHRWSYEKFVGPIPEGWVIDHLCRTSNCVNPEHLEAVTIQENSRRASNPLPEGATCARGHERTEEHLRRRKDGGVYCGTCANMTQGIRRARNRLLRLSKEWLIDNPDDIASGLIAQLHEALDADGLHRIK